MRVRVRAWAATAPPLLCPLAESARPTRHRQRAAWPAKHPSSNSPPTNATNSDASPTPPPRPRRWPSAHASSSAVNPPRCPTSHATTTSPTNSTATPPPFPSRVIASTVNASMGSTTSHAVAGPSLFPPEDRHKVLVLATTKPADLGLPTSQWSLDDMAYHILQDAHYKDMARSTIQRILAEADLKPHKSRYWLHSDDPDIEPKALDLCRLYLAAPKLILHGELVLCVDEKTSIQALQRARPTTPMAPGRPERRDYEYIRHGTRCLIATRLVATGRVLGSVTV